MVDLVHYCLTRLIVYQLLIFRFKISQSFSDLFDAFWHRFLDQEYCLSDIIGNLFHLSLQRDDFSLLYSQFLGQILFEWIHFNTRTFRLLHFAGLDGPTFLILKVSDAASARDPRRQIASPRLRGGTTVV